MPGALTAAGASVFKPGNITIGAGGAKLSLGGAVLQGGSPLVFDAGSGAGKLTLAVGDAGGSAKTLTLPAVTGSIVTTADRCALCDVCRDVMHMGRRGSCSGTVTGGMLSSSIIVSTTGNLQTTGSGTITSAG